MKNFVYDLGLSKLQELRDTETDPLVKAQHQRDIDKHFFGDSTHKRKNKKERKREKRKERMRIRDEEDGY